MQQARDLGFNTIRLEGQMVAVDTIHEEADRLGMLVVTGLQCCDSWQHWKSWTNATLSLALASVSSQVRVIRSHPRQGRRRRESRLQLPYPSLSLSHQLPGLLVQQR